MSEFIEFLEKESKAFVLVRRSLISIVQEASDEDDRPFTVINTEHGEYETWELYMDIKAKLIGEAE